MAASRKWGSNFSESLRGAGRQGGPGAGGGPAPWGFTAGGLGAAGGVR